MNANPNEPREIDWKQVRDVASRVTDRLTQQSFRLALAESCTAGLIGAAMGSVPGISDWWCGSMVTYRDEAKMDWLGIGATLLQEHTSVSQAASVAMVESVLAKTVEADMALAITGHLGRNPSDSGIVHVGISLRAGPVSVWSEELKTSERHVRQMEATCIALEGLLEFLDRQTT